MKRQLKLFGAVGVTVIAFSAMTIGSASASNFYASETGSLQGNALTNHVFTTNGGSITCATAQMSGSVGQLQAEDQEVTVNYSGCVAFGFVSATVSSAEYALHAEGEVDVLNTITISIKSLFGNCTITISPQSGLKSLDYENSGDSVVLASTITGIAYTSSGGICGSSGANGTYAGSSEMELNEGLGALAVAGVIFKTVNGIPGENDCEFSNENKECEIEFKDVGKAPGWTVKETKESGFQGVEPEVRYSATVGCTKNLNLANNESCKDVIKLKKLVEKTENEWCVAFKPEKSNEFHLVYCVKLKM